LMLPLGRPKFGWFRILKNSARNCTLKASEILLFLVTLKSRFLKLGPSKRFRAALPWVPTAGCVNAFTSNHKFGVGFSSFPLPTRFAYCGTKEPVLWTFEAVTLNGAPDCSETIPWIFHPLTINPATLPVLLKNFLPDPKGNA